jgi:hypothetical protein
MNLEIFILPLKKQLNNMRRLLLKETSLKNSLTKSNLEQFYEYFGINIPFRPSNFILFSEKKLVVKLNNKNSFYNKTIVLKSFHSDCAFVNKFCLLLTIVKLMNCGGRQ